MEQDLCNGRKSVRLTSVCLSRRRQQQRRAAGLVLSAAAGAIAVAGRGAQQQRRRSTTLSSKCGQCHVDSRRTRLNADLFCSVAHSTICHPTSPQRYCQVPATSQYADNAYSDFSSRTAVEVCETETARHCFSVHTTM